jgi:cytidyltransferase-like protein
MTTGVWLGRFQPVHNGHLDFLRAASEYCETIIVFVVGSSEPKGASIEADVMNASHESSRNPFQLADRFRWLTAAVREMDLPTGKILCSMGPRIDYDPAFYRLALPKDRVFLISDRDAAEERKRALLEMAGETCLAVQRKDWTPISSTMVRQAIYDQDTIALDNMLPKSTCNEIIRNFVKTTDLDV